MTINYKRFILRAVSLLEVVFAFNKSMYFSFLTADPPAYTTTTASCANTLKQSTKFVLKPALSNNQL